MLEGSFFHVAGHFIYKLLHIGICQRWYFVSARTSDLLVS